MMTFNSKGVVNTYYQACFFVLFWVHACNFISWHGDIRIGNNYDWRALIQTDQVYGGSFPELNTTDELNKTDAISVNLLMACLMLR